MNQLTYLFSAMEMIGTIAFAVSGVMVAIEEELDIMGALVLGCITATGGGALRDVLIGHFPPVLFTSPRYILVAAVVSIGTYVVALLLKDRFVQQMHRLDPFVNALDALGLGIFVTVGVDACFEAGFSGNAFLCIFIGTITGVGGGIFRDLLAMRVPMVLKKHVYAAIAIAGAILYYVLLRLGLNATLSMFPPVIAVTVLRILAAKYHWNLPRIHRA